MAFILPYTLRKQLRRPSSLAALNRQSAFVQERRLVSSSGCGDHREFPTACWEQESVYKLNVEIDHGYILKPSMHE